MKNALRFLAVIGVFLALTGFTHKGATSVEGNWVGEFTSIDQSVSFKVHFWQHDGGLKGTIVLPDEGSKALPLSWVMAESSNVHFELVEAQRTLVFDGILRDGVITGDLLFSNLRGSFQLAPDNLANL